MIIFTFSSPLRLTIAVKHSWHEPQISSGCVDSRHAPETIFFSSTPTLHPRPRSLFETCNMKASKDMFVCCAPPSRVWLTALEKKLNSPPATPKAWETPFIPGINSSHPKSEESSRLDPDSPPTTRGGASDPNSEEREKPKGFLLNRNTHHLRFSVAIRRQSHSPASINWKLRDCPRKEPKPFFARSKAKLNTITLAKNIHHVVYGRRSNP